MDLEDDILSVLFNIFADHTTLQLNSPAREYNERLKSSVDYRTLHWSIPLVCRRFYTLSAPLRETHLKIYSTRALHRFREERLDHGCTLERLTRLDVILNSRDGITELAVVLDQLSSLVELSFRHLERHSYMARFNAPLATRTLPRALVDSIAALPSLQTLIIHPGTSFVTRTDIERMAAGSSTLHLLHIPSTLYSPDPSPPIAQTNNGLWAHLQTLSLGHPRFVQTTNVFPLVLRNSEFPNLQHLNIVGRCWEDLTGYQTTLGRVHELETLSSNSTVWDALDYFADNDSTYPLLERVVLHVDDGTGMGERSYRHLRAVCVIDDVLVNEPSQKSQDRLEKTLRSILQSKAGSPHLHQVELYVLKSLADSQKGLSEFASQFRDRGISLTIHAVGSFD